MSRQVEKNARAIATDDLMEDLDVRAARGGVIAVMGQFASMLIQFANLAIMSRLLSPADFGLVAMAASVAVFLLLFQDLGLSTATIQRDRLDQDTASALFFMNLTTACCLMLLIFLSSPVGAWIFHDERVGWIISAMAISVPITALGAQHRALLSRRMRWITLQWVKLFPQLSALAVGTVAALWMPASERYWALVFSTWTASVVSMCLLWVVSPWRPSWVRDWTGAKEALGFGLNLTGFSLANYFHRQFDNLLIGWRWGTIELGHYSRAYSLLVLPISLINQPIASAVVPALSRLQGKPDWKPTYLRWLNITCLLGCLVLFTIIANADLLVSILLGNQWGLMVPILIALAFGGFATTIMNTVGWVYISLGLGNRMFQWALLATPLIALSFVIGLPFEGLGVATAYSIMMWLQLPFCFLFAAKVAPISTVEVIRTVIPTIAASVAASALITFVAEVRTDTSLEERLAFTLVGIVAIFAIWMVSMGRRERHDLRALVISTVRLA